MKKFITSLVLLFAVFAGNVHCAMAFGGMNMSDGRMMHTMEESMDMNMDDSEMLCCEDWDDFLLKGISVVVPELVYVPVITVPSYWKELLEEEPEQHKDFVYKEPESYFIRQVVFLRSVQLVI